MVTMITMQIRVAAKPNMAFDMSHAMAGEE